MLYCAVLCCAVLYCTVLYQVDLNYKTSAWDRLETETNLSLLSLLLMEWLEHLKTPVIDKVTENKIPTLVL